MFDADRAVEVISRGAAAGVEDGYGSGYYLGGGVVITCAHVLSEAPGVGLTVRGIDGRTVGARVVWCHRDHDVALLSVDEYGRLAWEVVPLCVLPRVTTDVVAQFVMFGWAKAGQVGKKRNPVQINGPIRLAEVAGGRTGTVRLRPGEGSPPSEYWRGMSGAAVFCEEHLIAVQVMQPDPRLDYLEGRLLTEEVLGHLDEWGRRGSEVLAAAGVAWGVTVTGIGRPMPAWLPRPAQLPRDAAMFTGRVAELERLLVMMPDPEHVSAVVISAIDGMAGVGKTALAVHSGHRMAQRFPDGQLFIDLHGFTQGTPPVEAGEALDRLLRALGVPGERIPAEVDERAGLWRSLLAGRRMLIVLDNAATEGQVLPLLPGVAGCLVLVTSRRRLAGLEAAYSLPLDTLPPADAVALFVRIAGREGLATQSGGLVVEAVQMCGRLPLAISIVAARLRSRPVWSVADLVGRLRDQGQRLAELDDGLRSVTAVLELSYRQLTEDEQYLYRLLGLHPGSDIDPYAAAALAKTTIAQARRLLERLLDAHLLEEAAPGRCAFHDLVRAHAAGTAASEITEPLQRAALVRLLGYYRHTVSVAMDVTHPYERERRPRVPPAGSPSPDLLDPNQANAWLNTELPNLLAAARNAAECGWPEHVWHLSALLDRHLRTCGHYRDAEILHNQALATARTSEHRAGELDALIGLGDVDRMCGRPEQAIEHYGQALDIALTTGNRTGELDALCGLGDVHRLQGRYEQAIDHFERVLAIAETTGHGTGELEALLGLGWIHLRQGRYEQAFDHYVQVLAIAQTTGNRIGELTALIGLGWVDRLLGNHEQATDSFGQALDIALATGNRTGELTALTGLGDVHLAQHRYEQALDHYAQALDIALATGNRTGELDALRGLGDAHLMQGQPEQATARYQQVLHLAQEIDSRNWQFEALHGLGRIQHATGHLDRAITHHQQALQLASDLRQLADQARAHNGLALVYQTLNQQEHARQHWQNALDILTGLGTDYTEDDQTNASTIRAHLANLDRHQKPPSASG